MEAILALDFQILDWIQLIRFDLLDSFMIFITKLGDEGIIWIVLGLLLCLKKKYRPYGLMVLGALICGLLIGNWTLKPLFARLRPFQIREGVELLIAPPSGFSFPSGHTRSSFEAAFVIWYMDKRAGVAALILAALITFSRMYLYVHFPTDILGGIALGAFHAFLMIMVGKHFGVKPLNK